MELFELKLMAYLISFGDQTYLHMHSYSSCPGNAQSSKPDPRLKKFCLVIFFLNGLHV